MKRRFGFTLIELLVVIAIIAILAAILLPVFARARENARKSTCLSNMKQVGSAMILYQSDYDQKFPGSGGLLSGMPGNAYYWSNGWEGWVSNSLIAYEKTEKIYLCPSDMTNGFPQWRGQGVGAGDVTAYSFKRGPMGNFPRSAYSWNYRGAANNTSDVAILEPGNLAVMWDSWNPWTDCIVTSTCGLWGSDGQTVTGRDVAAFMAGNFRYAGRHLEGNAFLFADGHTKWAKWSMMSWDQIANLPNTHVDYGRKCIFRPTGPSV